MKRIGLVSFAVTTGVLVPTALHTLTAGPDQVAKLVAPGSSSITVDGTKIAISVDKAIADAGDSVALTLTSTGTTATTVTVLMLESTGTSGGRVETPPNRVARHTITIPPNATKTLAMTMRGRRGLDLGGPEVYGTYTILVMPPQAARTLDKLRVAASGIDPMRDSDPEHKHDAFREAYAAKADSVARLQVHTRPHDSPVSIKTPAKHAVNDPFVVSVTVNNTTKKPWTSASVRLSTAPFELREGYRGLAEDDATIDEPSVAIDVPAHHSKTVTFRVTATELGTVGLEAEMTCNECEGVANNDWALDATDIVKAPETTTVVGQR